MYNMYIHTYLKVHTVMDQSPAALGTMGVLGYPTILT